MSSAEILRDSLAFETGPAARWPARFRLVLSKLVNELRQQSTGGHISIEPLRELRRPFSSVLHVRVTRGAQQSGAFIKILRPRSGSAEELVATRRNVQREYDVTCRIGGVVNGVAGLGAVAAIACFPEDFALVTGEVAGPTLSKVLTRSTSRWPTTRLSEGLADTLHLTSRWLRTAQQELEPDRDVSADTITRYLDRRINELGAPHGTLTASGQAGLRRCRDALLEAASRDGLRGVWIHADFCPDNIIAGKDGVTVLDFTMAGAGTRYHDIAHLYLGIESMRGKPWLNSGALDHLQAELLRGFEPDLDARQPLFVLARFQHVLCHLVALQGIDNRLARLRTEPQRRRYRGWLSQVAGVGPESWAG